MRDKIELLAPAGDVEAGYAALYFGADAIYLGLKRFSARAEAGNFTVGELNEITAYAHSMIPRRRVFLAVNTLVLSGELRDLVETLDDGAQCCVDAAIVQDIGVARIVKTHFPGMMLHASTQMAVHNVEGARTLSRMGFRRVTLARELSQAEVKEISAIEGIETEAFIHGALCYSYSGLCLFSSVLRGRSGNRGRCTYPCRDQFTTDGGGKRTDAAFPFSMKDLALTDCVPALREAGVAGLKIEGRMKSPLYVAVTTAMYRGALDGTLTPERKAEIESDARIVFSRRWTGLNFGAGCGGGAVDSEMVGHRGERIGEADAVIKNGATGDLLRFVTGRTLEKHDGLQIDLPGHAKPFGFAVTTLRCTGPASGGSGKQSSRPARNVIEAPKGSLVEVELPAGHPNIPAGSAIYCSSSQAVKRRYKHERPEQGEYRLRRMLNVAARLGSGRLVLTAVVEPVTLTGRGVTVHKEFRGQFDFARNAGQQGMYDAFGRAFARLGDTDLTLGLFELLNPEDLFVPASQLNGWRREVVKDIELGLAAEKDRRIGAVLSAISPMEAPRSKAGGHPSGQHEFEWIVKTDRIDHLSGFGADDWAGTVEAIIDIGFEPLDKIIEGCGAIGDKIGRDRIRLALPIVSRGTETEGIRAKVERLLAAGWKKWEIGNLSGLDMLGMNNAFSTGQAHLLELASDWPLYVMNREAIVALGELGVRRVTLSPEDGLENMGRLAAEFRTNIVAIVYQDTPLFISDTCPRIGLGACRGKRPDCREQPMQLVSSGGDRVMVVTRNCLAVTLARDPCSFAGSLAKLSAANIGTLRADFMWRMYQGPEAVAIWRTLRAGRQIPMARKGNLQRGMV